MLQIAQGSLYPALHRLEEEGWIEAEWGSSEANRQAKFYQLTKSGRKRLAAEEENRQRIAGAAARAFAGLMARRIRKRLPSRESES